MPLTEAEMAHIADLTVKRLLATKLGRSGPNVGIALQQSGRVTPPLNVAAVAAAVVKALKAATP